ncbi:uncharacterized protein [Lepeophtheirus salmonis]|uniref:uncharacterized protein n=1 Tax=Lepeophtheirus salmonis TaxID=72036 RepID=UPI001AE4C190|nr:uncharacterized protein LOC121119665 [Lepeophtheirus salmonis]
MDLSADEDSVFLSTSKSDMGLCSKQEGVNVSKKTDSLRQLPESFHYKNNLAESELKTSVKSKIHGQEKHSGDYDLMGLNAKKIRMMPSGNDLIKTHLHNELEIVNSGSHVRNEDDYKKECERPKNLEVPLGLNEKSKDIQQSKKVEEGITNKATDLIVDGTNRKMNNTSSHDLDDKKKYATIQKTHINHIHSEISIPQEVDVEVNPSSKTFHKERNYSSGSTLESKNDNINSYSTNEREYENIHISGSSLTINSESQEENQTANRNTILNPSQSDRSTPQKLMPSTALTPVFKTISKEKDVESMKLSPSSFFESSKSKMTKSNAHELHSKNENTRCSQDTTSDLNAFINGSNLERENWLPQIETPPMSNKRMLNDSDHVPSNNSSYSETYNSFRVDVSGEDSVQEKNNPCMKPIINIFNYYEKEQLSFEDGYKYTDFHIEHMSDHLVTLSFMEGKFKLDFYIEKLCSVEEKENILIQHCKINDVVGLVQYTQSDAFVNMVLGLVDTILLKSNMLKGIMRITNRFKDFLGLIRSHLSSACKMIIAETKIFHNHPGSGLDKKNPKVYRVLFSGFYFYFRMNINFESGLDYIRKSVSCSLSEGGCNIDFILDLAQKSKQSWLFFEDYIKKIDLYVKYMDALYVKSLDIKSS